MRTRIQLPPIRDGHIRRERVLRQLDADTDARLALVSAPAGFGKSALLIDWAHNLRENGALVVWYALDEGDNDPARFTAYLLEAFREQTGLTGLPDAGPAVELGRAVQVLLDAAAVSGHKLVLLLDDYHLITEPSIHAAVGRMCDYLPRNMRLAIGTRADPPLQLARLRVRGEMTEIRMGDLRFNATELREWFGAALNWQPSPEGIDALQQTTEGWAAALALILMNQSGTDEAALRQQLARYSQSQQHIFEYFAQEILDAQPEPVRRFLLETCVLNRLEPDICQAITDQTDAPLVLNQLARASLFVIPLSAHEPLYRYHHLFADFLRQYLTLHNPDKVLKQHRRAAAWYAEQDQVVAAVHHALAAGDFDEAARLVEARAWEALTTRGEIMTVVRWLARFPQDSLRQHPRLCLYFSRALYLTGDADASQEYVQMAMDTLEADKNMTDPALWAIACGYQATLAGYRGEVEAGLRWIEQANAQRNTVGGVDRVRIANTDAFLRYLMDTIPVARRAYQHALALAQAIDHDFLALDAHFYLAQIDFLAADLPAVADRCESLLAQYTNRIAPLAAVMVPLARAQYQRNQVVQAEATLREALELAGQANLPDILWLAHINLAEVLAMRDPNEAADAITEAQRIAHGFQSPVIGSIIVAAQARLWLQTGQLAEAAAWAERFQQSPPTAAHRQFERVIALQVLLAQRELDRVLALAPPLIADAQQAGRVWYVIRGHSLHALAHQAAGNTPAALAALEAALRLARPSGAVRPFLGMGTPMLRLLQQAVSHEVVPDTATHLLGLADAPRQHPADALTEREIEVLEHIAAGASNSDIAGALVISLGTVKSHIHRLMNKLHAQNRTEAVSKARALHILSD